MVCSIVSIVSIGRLKSWCIGASLPLTGLAMRC